MAWQMKRTLGDIKTVLVANRGEIALRIARTCRALGLRVVAVYSEADADSPHVAYADEAVSLGGRRAQDSYLCIEKIIGAARASGADAIAPGYGFLAESPELARATANAGLVFIGPSPQAMEAMGAKDRAKTCALEAGVACIPGYQGAYSDWQAVAREIGLPVMLKAVHGGGGRGMRLVHREADLALAVAAAEREATASFGRAELLMEKALMGARHIEVQVFGDNHGNVVHLGERDCSVQRRYQKIIEECPSPFLTDSLREAIAGAAVKVSRAVGYAGAGTVEFLVASSGEFFFLEMNTRLQVEHGVTEAVYGVDLVEWQIRVARGEPLPLSQSVINARRHGWAIEARLCAEDPARGFLPQSGKVTTWTPPTGEGIRVDHCLNDELTITPFYDSLLAKIIGVSDTREKALAALSDALASLRLEGVKHNGEFLHRVLAAPDFARGDYTTSLLDELQHKETGDEKLRIA